MNLITHEAKNEKMKKKKKRKKKRKVCWPFGDIFLTKAFFGKSSEKCQSEQKQTDISQPNINQTMHNFASLFFGETWP